MKDCASSASVSKGSRRAASCEASIAPWASPAAERRWLSSRKRSERNSTVASNASAPTRKPAEIVNTTRLKIYSPGMRISTSSPEYKLSKQGAANGSRHEKRRAPWGTRLLKLRVRLALTERSCAPEAHQRQAAHQHQALSRREPRRHPCSAAQMPKRRHRRHRRHRQKPRTWT